MNLRPFGIAALCTLILPAPALAGPPDEAEGEAGASASASLDVGTDADTDADADAGSEASSEASSGVGDRSDQPWIKRWAPERNMLELGIYGGAFFPNANHELFEADRDLPDQGFKQLSGMAPDVGLRAGYYPSRFFGIEAEGGLMPAGLAQDDGAPLLYTVRGQLVGQLGLWSVTPFVLVGAGGLGVSSPRDVLGNDIDPAMHWGGGVKIYMNRWTMLRFDVRDVVSYKRELENVFVGHNLEILAGLSFTLGRKKDEAPPDRDGDGLIDAKDSCPDDAETFNDYQDEDGCPEQDQDGDGFYDDQDSCPAEAETVNDYQDEDGCPEQDPDGDRFFDEHDQCPQEPESDNGYKDDDGCPDEVPKEVQDFTGTIKGITFDTDKDTIRKSSTRTLDKAVEVLEAHPGIRIKISGHTDNQGEHDHNLDLSKRRAAAVKDYLVGQGIDTSRVETEGYGPDKPIDTNDTKRGRANNRRIEFEIIRQAR